MFCSANGVSQPLHACMQPALVTVHFHLFTAWLLLQHPLRGHPPYCTPQATPAYNRCPCAVRCAGHSGLHNAAGGQHPGAPGAWGSLAGHVWLQWRSGNEWLTHGAGVLSQCVMLRGTGDCCRGRRGTFGLGAACFLRYVRQGEGEAKGGEGLGYILQGGAVARCQESVGM